MDNDYEINSTRDINGTTTGKKEENKKFAMNENSIKMNLRSNSKRCTEAEMPNSIGVKRTKMMRKIGPGTFIEETFDDFDDSPPPVFDDNINPFLLDPVCQILFKHMSVDELKNARLVCNLWETNAVERLEEIPIKQIELFTGSGCERKIAADIMNPRIFDTFKINYVCTPSREIFDVIKPSCLKIYTKVESSTKVIESSVGKANLKEMIYNLSKVSSNLKVFSFEYQFYAYEPSGEYTYKFHHQEIKKMDKISFPLLHKIHIHNLNGNVTDKSDFNYKMYDVLTKNSPKLKSLSLQSVSITPKFTQISRENKVLSKLEELNVRFCSNIEALEERQMKGLLDLTREDLSLKTTNQNLQQLKKIAIVFKQYDVNLAMYFADFLASQSNSLVSLAIQIHITNNTLIHGLRIGTTRMPYLEKLENLFIYIQGGEINYINRPNQYLWTHSFHPINFSNKFPSLKYLEISNMSKFQSIISNGSSSLKTIKIPLKYLRFDCMEAVDFHRLGLLFQNIEEFHYPAWYLPQNGAEIPWSKLKKIRLYIDEFKEININHLKELEEIEIFSFELCPLNKSNYQQLFDSFSKIDCISNCTLKFTKFDSISEYVVERFKSICKKFCYSTI